MPTRSSPRYVPALGFAWLTPWYDAVMRTTLAERRFKQALIAQAAVAPGQRVLDLACGTGTLTVWLKQHQPGTEVRGVDGDPAVLARAARKAAAARVEVGFDQALSTQLPYPDASFERVVSSLFFHHLSPADRQRTVVELFRVVRPGGEVHVADWGRPAGPLMHLLFFPIRLLDGFNNTRDSLTGRLVEILAAAGFRDATVRHTFATLYGTLTLYSAIRPPSP